MFFLSFKIKNFFEFCLFYQTPGATGSKKSTALGNLVNRGEPHSLTGKDALLSEKSLIRSISIATLTAMIKFILWHFMQ